MLARIRIWTFGVFRKPLCSTSYLPAVYSRLMSRLSLRGHEIATAQSAHFAYSSLPLTRVDTRDMQ